MAEIAVPASLALDAITLELAYPGRVHLESPFTGDAVNIDRGNPRWTGTATVALLAAEAANPIDAFLSQLNETKNFAELPLGSRASTFTATTISSVSANTITLAAIPSGLRLHDYIRSGNRLYQVTSLASATGEITVSPSGLLAASDPISQARTIRARLSKPAKTLSRAGGFAGPGRIAFSEAI